MSIADAERFAKDLSSNKELLERVKSKVSGLASLVEVGAANGYVFTIDEIKQILREAAKSHLTDDQLEVIAGGRAAPAASSSSPPIVATTTNSEVASTTNVFGPTLDYGVTQQAATVVVVLI